MHKLIPLPTGYTVPDCEHLSSIVLDDADHISDMFNMHSPDFLKDLSGFYNEHNVKRFLELEGEIKHIINDSNKIAYEQFINIVSLLNHVMSNITTHDWFKAQFNSNRLSSLDKEFLVGFLRLLSRTHLDRNGRVYEVDPTQVSNEYNKLVTFLNIPNNRVKSNLIPVNSKVVNHCMHEFNEYKSYLPLTWSNFITELLYRFGPTGFNLVLLFVRAVFLTGYSDRTYNGS